jgi:hypothetical protein
VSSPRFFGENRAARKLAVTSKLLKTKERPTKKRGKRKYQGATQIDVKTKELRKKGFRRC